MLATPPLLVLAVGISLGEGYGLLRTLDGVPVVGTMVRGLVPPPGLSASDYYSSKAPVATPPEADL